MRSVVRSLGSPAGSPALPFGADVEAAVDHRHMGQPVRMADSDEHLVNGPLRRLIDTWCDCQGWRPIT